MLNIFKKKKYNEGFIIWLEALLKNNDFEGVVAFNFNLYEGDNSYHIELIGSDEYDPGDSDWVCSERFASRDNILIVDEKVSGKTWEKALVYFRHNVEQYLIKGQFKDKLLSKAAVGIGFVDGDLEILYENKS